MPKDLSKPHWACLVCGGEWEGQNALARAVECEESGLPVALDPGTWFVSNGNHSSLPNTVGGFRLMQVTTHTVKRSYEGGPHLVAYEQPTASEVTDRNLYPHLSGVLNTHNFTGESLHGNRLETVVADSDDVASDFVAMLAYFGITTTSEELKQRTSEVYTSFVFGDPQLRRIPTLPPLRTLSAEVQAAFQAVSTGLLYWEPNNVYYTDEHGKNRMRSERRLRHELHFDAVNSDFADDVLRARALSFAGVPADVATARWYAGADVLLPAEMLTSAGGEHSSTGTKITIQQRNAMRNAGFEVRWPARLRGMMRDEINSPDAALKALVERHKIVSTK